MSTGDTPPPLPPSATPVGPPPLPGAAPAPVPVEVGPVGTGPVGAGSAGAGPAERSFACVTCGSQVSYVPGTTELRCAACGTVQRIEVAGTVDEHSYDAWAALPRKPVATIAAQVLRCRNCGAETETADLAGICQFCNGVLVALDAPAGLVAPEAIVPFGVDTRGANDAFRTWVRSRRFAPKALRQVGSTERIRGTYIPHWTYDARSATAYDGKRGDHYYVTQTRTVSDGKGGTRTETYQQQRTRWRNASGQVARDFDDVLVPASHRLDDETLEKMGPWSLGAARAFQADYLAGYSALRYDVDPDTGLGVAKSRMAAVIEGDVRADIGGDVQQIDVLQTRYAATMFKLVLLPLWIASYVFGGATYQVLVNANTGEVVGDRPYSKLKIALAVLAGLVVVAAIVVGIVLARR